MRAVVPVMENIQPFAMEAAYVQAQVVCQTEADAAAAEASAQQATTLRTAAAGTSGLHALEVGGADQ